MSLQPVGVIAIVQGFGPFMAKMGAMNKSILGLGASGTAAAGGLSATSLALGAVGVAAAASAAAVALVVVGIGKIAVEAVQTAISVEAAFAGVLKTTNDLGTGLFDLTEKGKRVFQEFRDLSKEVPLGTEELSFIGQLGGQLNVASEDIADFTKTIASIAVSTDLTEDEAALGLARISSQFGFTTDEIAENVERQGSAIVYLGNNYATTEQEILLASRNISGAGALFGMTQADIFAIGASIKIAGVSAEAGGTAVTNAMIEMNSAVQEGGDALAGFAEVAALSGNVAVDDFAKLWEEDAQEAFLAFVQGLEASGKDASGILDELGLGSARSQRTFLGLANNVGILEQAFIDSNRAFEQNTALAREAEIRFGTLESKIIMTKNKIRDVALEIGLALAPAVITFLDSIDFEGFANKIRTGVIPAVDSLVKKFMDFFGLSEDEGPQLGGLGVFGPEALSPAQELVNSILIPIQNLQRDIQEPIENIKTAFAGLVTAFQEDAPGLKAVLEDINEFMSETFGSTTQEKLNNTALGIDGLTEAWDLFGLRVIENISTFGQFVSGIMPAIFQELKRLTIVEVAAIGGIWLAFTLALAGDMDSAGETIKATLAVTLTEALAAVGGFIDDLIAVFTDNASYVENAARKLGNAISKGLGLGFGSGTIPDMNDGLQGVIDNAEKIYDSDSPSKVFMKIGQDVVRGLAIGLGDTSALVPATETMANSVLEMPATVMPSSGFGSTSADNSRSVTVHANYYKTQSPNQIVDDLALVSALGA